MEIKQHRAFLSIIGINLALWTASLLVPNLPEWLGLNAERLWLLPTYVTCLFAHAGFGHLFGNMLFVLPWAIYLEPKIGSRRFLAAWLITGVAGDLGWLLTPSLMGISGVSLGSSGACMGILALAALLMDGHWAFKAGAASILAIVGLQEYQLTVISALIPDGIGHCAHLWGAAAGALLAGYWRRGGPSTPEQLSCKTACDPSPQETLIPSGSCDTEQPNPGSPSAPAMPGLPVGPAQPNI